MIAMVHQLLLFSSKYAKKIRLAYVFTFLKAVAANAPLMVAIKLIDMLIKGEAEFKTAAYAAAAMLILLSIQAVYKILQTGCKHEQGITCLQKSGLS
ncbi:MAG: hypothetical protein ACTTI3_07780 [Treponema sp.]